MKKILLIIFGLFIFFTQSIPTFAKESSTLGKAINIQYEEVSFGNPQLKQIIDVKILNGDNKGSVVTLENILGTNPYYDINVQNNDKLVLFTESENNSTNYYISDIYRLGTLNFLICLFCILLIIIGRKKGLFSLISIAAIIALIFYVLCPLILSGISPLLATLFVSLLSTVITIYLVGGVNRKSSAAIIGTISSLILAGICACATINFAKLTGFSDETTLFLYSSHPELDFTSITASIIILAALGAVMDVAMSIASTINEINLNNNALSAKDLFNAGMNVGRDIIGTMANTLILVYLGGAIPLILLVGNIDTYKFFNLNSVVTEISSAVIGSIGLLVCVPLTALCAAILIKNNSNNLNNRDIIISKDFEKEENND